MMRIGIRSIDRMVLSNILSVFIIALLFFVLIIQIIDLFGNLTRYINQEVPFIEVLGVQALFVPKSISYALPMALLFAIAFSMGTLYSNNELVAILGAGIPLIRLVTPILLMGLFFSVFSFYFEDQIVIPVTREKNVQSRELLGVSRSFSNADVTLIGAQGRVVYFADYYNDASETLTNVLFIIRSRSGRFQSRIEGRSSRWNGSSWEVPGAAVFEFDDSGTITRFQDDLYTRDILNTDPRSFRRQTQDVDDLTYEESRDRIETLRSAGLPYRSAQTQYYERIAFSFTPLIVSLLSCAIGGRLKKNILLLSLLISLVISVGYYVIQMVLSLLAGAGGIPPLIGAFSGVFVFFIIGTIMLYRAKT